mgnify:CR=1 FL=1
MFEKAEILIVDDMPEHIAFAGTILRNEGFRVLGATSAKAALKMMENSKPHLVLLDIKMEGMDGLELCRHFKSGDTLKELPETDKIKGEFLQNGFAYNSLEHLLGTISMARLPFDYNSATSQFFICAADCPTLDDEYAAFGRAVELVSQGVVVNLSTIPTATLGTGFADFPTEIVSIVKVRIQDEAF